MADITRPTVRTPPNSAGTSLTTMRCRISPPPPLSPRLPTSCFTPPCDGAVSHTKREHYTEAATLEPTGVFFFFVFPFFKSQLWGPGTRSCGLSSRVRGDELERVSMKAFVAQMGERCNASATRGLYCSNRPSALITDNLETNQMLLLLLYRDGCILGQTASSEALLCLFCRNRRLISASCTVQTRG